jgi:hypothetical protein
VSISAGPDTIKKSNLLPQPGSEAESGYRPVIRISRNTDLNRIHDFMYDASIVIGMGNNSVISTSKIMKITAIRRIVMKTAVVRSFFFALNSHSNGDLFSRPSLIFFDIGWLGL